MLDNGLSYEKGSDKPFSGIFIDESIIDKDSSGRDLYSDNEIVVYSEIEFKDGYRNGNYLIKYKAGNYEKGVFKTFFDEFGEAYFSNIGEKIEYYSNGNIDIKSTYNEDGFDQGPYPILIDNFYPW